jgi:putative ATPase
MSRSLFPEDEPPSSEESKALSPAPLADRVRPETLDAFFGQDHLLGEGRVLRRLVESDRIGSIILWGPPGVGKTTLARIISNTTRARFVSISAVLSGIREVKQIIDEARQRLESTGQRTVLFVDEIHRFNKAQQDAFLPHVEKGTIILIGATTENPSFEVISALLSRSKVFVLNPLEKEAILGILRRAVESAQGLGGHNLRASDHVLEMIAAHANGDARNALNTLDLAATLSVEEHKDEGPVELTPDHVQDALQKKALLYDKSGEEHFNLISALHKSLRNSDAQASLYWLVRMLESGEDPLYVARRMVRFASEDIGLADPGALRIALDAKEAVHFLGMPEGKLALAQAALYMAMAPKSNAVYAACSAVENDLNATLSEPVPLHLRNAPTSLMKNLGYGKGYRYAHDEAEHTADMACLPESLAGRVYYQPAGDGFEKTVRERMEQWAARRKK